MCDKSRYMNAYAVSSCFKVIRSAVLAGVRYFSSCTSMLCAETGGEQPDVRTSHCELVESSPTTPRPPLPLVAGPLHCDGLVKGSTDCAELRSCLRTELAAKSTVPLSQDVVGGGAETSNPNSKQLTAHERGIQSTVKEGEDGFIFVN